MKRILQQSVILMTSSAIMVLSILTISMVIIPQAAYAQEYQGNQSSSNQSSSTANCASDQLPASINGTIQCMRQGECYSEEFDGKEVKHCNFMMSNQ